MIYVVQIKNIIAYWRDCVKAEGALEQSFAINSDSFSLHEKVNAHLFTGKRDPFIFAHSQENYILEEGRVNDQIYRATLKGQDVYFGYPVLMFYNKDTKQNCITPLFTIRLEVKQENKKLVLSRAELIPNLGNCAFVKLGLNPEEIVALNNEITSIFESNKSSKIEIILYLLQNKTHLTFVEGIDPTSLSVNSEIQPYDGTVVYNKAILSIGDTSAFNVHLLNDLEKLSTRQDLNDSSLNYIEESREHERIDKTPFTPILPFLFDEYHLQAIQHIMDHENSVITGPPGTGKSQFIANLIVNLFIQRKRVLFVSHTGEAVRVVNERINSEFANLIMQTGKKKLRQDLGDHLGEMVRQYNDTNINPVDIPEYKILVNNWQTIEHKTAYLKKTSHLNKRLELIAQRHTNSSSMPNSIIKKFQALGNNTLLQYYTLRIRNRQSNYDILAELEQHKQQHIKLSHSYVKGTYLNTILNNGLYGDLSTYIDIIQNNKQGPQHALNYSDKYVDAALNAMNIWSCTLKSVGASFPLKANLFDYVIFDEASQIDLPSAAPALYRARRSVIVGDENQLTHIARINSKTEEGLAKKYDLMRKSYYPSYIRYTDTSLFLSAKKSLHEPELELKNHYRSNSRIANLFSSIFYGGKLHVYEPPTVLPEDIKAGVYWIDAQGASYKPKAGSLYNPLEASYIIKLLEKLLPMARERNLSIGVATAYAKQQTIIANKIAKTFPQDDSARIQVLTVHKFQGSEVDMLVFSPVLSKKGDGRSDYWYIQSKQLLNVAISRAKHLLFIVGDREYALTSDSKLREIAQYCIQSEDDYASNIPNRPMNIFEKQLFDLLKPIIIHPYRLTPQHVVGGRFTVDFALISPNKRIAIELDGGQHEIVGGLPVFEDKQRDEFLQKEGWDIMRIPLYKLQNQKQSILRDVSKIQVSPTL